MIGIRILGLDALKAKLNPAALIDDPIKTALLKSALTVEGQSKRNTPVDSGRLRASETHRLEGTPVRAAYVGTDVEYAKHVHDGTRRMKGRPFFTQALQQSQEKIRGFFEAAARAIESKWRS